jgi:hypothetical protein
MVTNGWASSDGQNFHLLNWKMKAACGVPSDKFAVFAGDVAGELVKCPECVAVYRRQTGKMPQA